MLHVPFQAFKKLFLKGTLLMHVIKTGVLRTNGGCVSNTLISSLKIIELPSETLILSFDTCLKNITSLQNVTNPLIYNPKLKAYLIVMIFYGYKN